MQFRCTSAYPMDIRKAIYATNAIDSLNPSLRKVIKTKAVFPDEESVFKLMHLAMNNIAKRWTRPIKNLCISVTPVHPCQINAQIRYSNRRK